MAQPQTALLEAVHWVATTRSPLQVVQAWQATEPSLHVLPVQASQVPAFDGPVPAAQVSGATCTGAAHSSAGSGHVSRPSKPATDLVVPASAATHVTVMGVALVVTTVTVTVWPLLLQEKA